MKRLVTFLMVTLCFPVSAKLPNVAGGKIERIENFQSNFIPPRHIDIWLPPNFDSDKNYPVIYMHDGQMLFDGTTTWNGQEWKVDEIATDLIVSKLVQPFVIVGTWNVGANRHSEYFPQKPFESLSEDEQKREYNRLRGNAKLFNKPIYSDQYLKFLVEELKPLIGNKYNVDNDNAYLMGSSMGGLISWYGLVEYPNEFRGAACLSTHWPGNFDKVSNPVPNAFVSFIKKHINVLKDQRIYFDTGTEGLDAMYPAIQAKVDSVMVKTELNWVSLTFDGADHSEGAWADRLHLPILFLLNGEKPK